MRLAWNIGTGVFWIATIVAWLRVVGPTFVWWRRIVLIVLLASPGAWLNGYVVPIGAFILLTWAIVERRSNRRNASAGVDLEV